MAVTDRQLEVLGVVVASGTIKGAAHELGLSASTVRQHLESIRQRLGVETTMQAAVLLAARGALRVELPR